MTQINLSDIDVNGSNKDIMLNFLASTVGLNEAEKQQITEYAKALATNVTLPEFLQYLQTTNLASELLEKLKIFGRDD